MNLHTSPSSLGSGRASFTLIELLIVIAVVAILSVVVILSLNPAELLRQAWDSNRIADINTLNRILTYTRGNVGVTSTVYFSLVDPAATSTAGTDCTGVGGLVPPSGWTYHCAASSTLRAVDGTGWLPLDLSSPGFGGSLSGLPVDPTNTSSSGLYYMFVRGASGYAVAAGLQSQKFLGPRGSGDDGYDPGRIEMGSNLSLIAQSEGLVGWWRFDEGTGSAVADASGSGNNGTLTVGTSSAQWASSCKVGGCLTFDGADDGVNVGNLTALSGTAGLTIVAWIQTTSNAEGAFADSKSGGYNGFSLQLGSADPSRVAVSVATSTADGTVNGTTAVNSGTWHLMAGTFNAGITRIFVDGVQENSNTLSFSQIGIPTQTTRLGIASNGTAIPFSGSLDEVRIYNRALTAAEILAMYNAQK